MVRYIQLPARSLTSSAPGDPHDGARTHSLATELAAALSDAGESVPGGGSYCEIIAAFFNAGSGDAYLAHADDLPVVPTQYTITITTTADGTWTITLTAPDNAVIVAEFEASSDTEAEVAAGLRAALTTEVAGHGLVVSGAGAEVIVTGEDDGVVFAAPTVEPAAGGAATVEETTDNETTALTTEVIPGGTDPGDALTFGPFFSTKLPAVRCLIGASLTLVIKLGLP